ncbi:Hypothetical predicted protein [Podarcis lilfordi]|uniref:Uncharacterized protein n=1 Tax=Podarcis lilfordi TaxID=74358 RepID=A0AA35KM17_9SAUR|nr:Hypothetical predicted protein [Podarcis lilfordi]
MAREEGEAAGDRAEPSSRAACPASPGFPRAAAAGAGRPHAPPAREETGCPRFPLGPRPLGARIYAALRAPPWKPPPPPPLRAAASGDHGAPSAPELPLPAEEPALEAQDQAGAFQE